MLRAPTLEQVKGVAGPKLQNKVTTYFNLKDTNIVSITLPYCDGIVTFDHEMGGNNNFILR